MSSPNCCFLTCIQVSQDTGQVVWSSHLFQNFPQFIVIHTVKGFGIVNKAEINISLELSLFFRDPVDVGVLKKELPRLVGAQYATGDQWRNNSRKNEGWSQSKNMPSCRLTGDGSKVHCYKEQCCIGTWNVRSMNQGKLKVVKQEKARVNIDILGISELK